MFNAHQNCPFGADITTCDNDKKTPLQYAVECNFTHIAEFLAQQERFQLLVVHDIHELLKRLGLYSVERNAILSMLHLRESNSNDQLDCLAIRTEYFAQYNAS
jgi:hypothetical protein